MAEVDMHYPILTEDGDFAYPESLDFHIPGKDGVVVPLLTPINYESVVATYRQLICWCLFQRYWYYVCGTPQVGDTDYDAIEKFIQQMEVECGLECTLSPVGTIGSSRREDYPPFIRHCFQ